MPRPSRGAYLKYHAPRKRFYIYWYQGASLKKRSTGTSDGREAEKILAAFISDRNADHAGPEQYLVAQALTLYAEGHAATTQAPERIGYAISALLPFFGERRVQSLTEDDFKTYAKERGKAPGTIRRELTTLRAAINYAARSRKFAAPHIWLPKKPKGKDRWLTRNDAARLLNAARTARKDIRQYLPLFIVLALYTGARKGALLELRWAQINFKTGRINLHGEVETNKGRSVLPIPRRLMTFLRYAHANRYSDTGFVINDRGHRIKDIGDGRNGSFGSAVTKAGLQDVTPHTLRHTCGTWLAQAGTPLWEIGGWLGQSQERTTEAYAHHHPDHLGTALANMDRR